MQCRSTDLSRCHVSRNSQLPAFPVGRFRSTAVFSCPTSRGIDASFGMFVELSHTGLQKIFSHPALIPRLSKPTNGSHSVAERPHTSELLFPTAPPVSSTIHYNGPSGTLRVGKETQVDGEDIQVDCLVPNIRLVVSQEGTTTARPKVIYDSESHLHRRSYQKSRATSRYQHRRSLSDKDSSRRHDTTSLRRSSVSTILGTTAERSSGDESHSQGLPGFGALRKAPTLPSLSSPRGLHHAYKHDYEDNIDDIAACVFGSSGLPPMAGVKFHIKPPTKEERRTNSDELPHSGMDRRPDLPLGDTPSVFSKMDATGGAVKVDDELNFAAPLTLLVTLMFAIDTSQCADPGPAIARVVDNNSREVLRRTPHFAVTLALDIPHEVSWPLDTYLRDRGGLETTYSQEYEKEALQNPYSFSEPTVQYIMGHWVNLMRALRTLENTIRPCIEQALLEGEPHLQKLNPLSQAVNQDHQKNLNRNSWAKRQHNMHFSAHALQATKEMTDRTTLIINNLRRAFCIRRCATGSRGWATWKSEARLLSTHMGAKRHNFFLFNVLTAFLGNQLSWLGPLMAKLLRRTNSFRSASAIQEDMILDRTIIVCNNSDLARRLIYTLCSFIQPARSHSAQIRHQSMSPRSTGSISQSPPLFGHLGRQQSLRRSIGRRAGSNITLGIQAQVNAPLSESLPTAALETLQPKQHARRSSETGSVRKLSLSVPQADPSLRKTSAGVVSATVPIRQAPTFVGTSRHGTWAEPRPGSSGSLATLSLQRTLSRSGSSNIESPTSPGPSRWGSVMSGFWSLGRRASTERSEAADSFDDGLGILNLQVTGVQGPNSPSKANFSPHGPSHRRVSSSVIDEPPFSAATVSYGTALVSSTPAKDIPLLSDNDDYPLKFSVDEEDGVIDIELPPDSSAPSSLNSSNTNTAASSFNEHASSYGRHRSRHRQHAYPQGLTDVAGYLHTFHPDFVLQALKPSATIKSEVTQSLRDEAAQNLGTSRRYSALIANATDFTVTLHTLQDGIDKEEAIMDLDPIFVDAVERLIISEKGTDTDKDCKRMIWSALESVVKGIIAEEESKDESHEWKDDNILREGIRRWIRERHVLR